MPHAIPSASRLTPTPQRPATLDLRSLQQFVTTVFGEYAHAKRLESIANASAGVLHAASWG
ncbi:MAG TPA: hypothetical protein VFS43_08615 [Polyangiaceae bacterium]|nr:hypothetical protein [Polyangiaceae bacterium]